MKALLVVLVLLVGGLLVADPAVEAWAEDRVALEIARQGRLAGAPTVDIGGTPFLTQAVRGRYDDVRIRLAAEQLRQPEGTRADITLRGVRLPLSELASDAVQEVPVDRVEGTVVLSYELLSAQLGPGTTLRPDRDGLRITRTVELLGREVPLTATGRLRLDGDEVVIDVARVSGAGVRLPGVVVDRAADLLDLRYAVPALPFGLRLDGVRPRPDGVHVGVASGATVLRG